MGDWHWQDSVRNALACRVEVDRNISHLWHIFLEERIAELVSEWSEAKSVSVKENFEVGI